VIRVLEKGKYKSNKPFSASTIYSLTVMALLMKGCIMDTCENVKMYYHYYISAGSTNIFVTVLPIVHLCGFG
jgi:hypothetical protein